VIPFLSSSALLGTGLVLVFSMTACSPSTPPASQVPQAALSPVGTSLAIDGLPVRYQEINYPLFQYVPPHPKDYRVVLSDSITGYLVSDRSLPLVNLTFYFRESALPARPQETASLQLLSSMFRRGGGKTLPPAVLDDSLEFLSAGLGGGLGNSQSSISLNCLSRDLPAVLGMVRKVFLDPAMDSLQLELLRAAAIQSIEHRFDQPSAQLEALSSKVMYLSGPRTWDALPAEVSAVSRKQLLEMAPRFFEARRVVFAAAGDFDRDSMAIELKKLFADWKKPATPPAVTPPQVFQQGAGVFVSDKKISQAHILMAQPFVKRPHPDYYPAMVASYILGGSGFTSRLTEKVRSDEGLAYSVYSFASSDYDDEGTAGVALQTKVSSAAYALSIVRREVQKLAQNGPTAQELDGAKKALISSLPGMFDSPAATADAFARSEMWGRSPDHFVQYPEKISAVTAAQVQQMIAKYFDPARMRISIVGPLQDLLQKDTTHQVSLQDFGPVTLVPVDSLWIR